MGFLSDEERATLRGAEDDPARTPLPLQMVSSDEFMPSPQTAKQRAVGARLNALADEIAPRHALSRRRFFQTSAGMAAAFVAMNETYGALFAATRDEARTPEMADSRAAVLKDQFVVDIHTHFVREDLPLQQSRDLPFPWRAKINALGWNPQLRDKVSLEMVMFDNYRKEIFLDSDTKIALISSVPIAKDPPLTNKQMADARAKVNAEAGARRMLSHALFTPGKPGWLDDLEAGLALKPDSIKGYTIGSETSTGRTLWPWRMDDEATYKGYEKMLAAGVKTVCVHKGLFPPSMERINPDRRVFADVSDVGKAAKDWPHLNFVIYHSAYRHVGDPNDAEKDPEFALAEFERTGRISWTSELADIPEKYGVSNVYGDLGQTFAMTMIAQPRLCAAIMGTLIKGLGADHICWGTDAVWTGSPQWQIEGLRRLEIPEDMRNHYGFTPLGPPDGPVKSAIFANNSARLYNIDSQTRIAVRSDRIAALKADYERFGRNPSNARYGYVSR
jgi:uncharacterized protein